MVESLPTFDPTREGGFVDMDPPGTDDRCPDDTEVALISTHVLIRQTSNQP